MEASQVLDGSHSYESDCIGCSPPPQGRALRVQRQNAVVRDEDLPVDSEDPSASGYESPEFPDASEDPLLSELSDDSLAKEDVPGN